MSTNKKNVKISNRDVKNPAYTGPVKRPVIIVGDQQIPVSTPTAKKFYRYHGTLYLDKIISAFLMFGIIGYLGAYIYYSYDNNKLLHKASGTCPVVYCPAAKNPSSGVLTVPLECEGKAYYIDNSDNNKKKVCTV